LNGLDTHVRHRLKGAEHSLLGAKQMIREKEVKKLLSELLRTDTAKIDLGGSSVTIKVFDTGRKVFVSTPVYFGGNYIPKSVRNCVKEKAPFNVTYLQTTLTIDEENFSINLNYTGDMGEKNGKIFIHILEDFSELAEKWRRYLDEHDQNDLVPIPVR